MNQPPVISILMTSDTVHLTVGIKEQMSGPPIHPGSRSLPHEFAHEFYKRLFAPGDDTRQPKELLVEILDDALRWAHGGEPQDKTAGFQPEPHYCFIIGLPFLPKNQDGWTTWMGASMADAKARGD